MDTKKHILFLNRKLQVYGPINVSVGDFDPTADCCYRNIVTIPIDVKPRMMLYVKVNSDNFIDVVVAKDDYSSVCHRYNITADTIGPLETGNSRSMGIILGIFRGDKANVLVDVWMSKK